MRNALLFLSLLGAALLAITVLLPVLGVIFLLVVGALVVAVGAILAAPLLAKLPWFRDRIVVEQYGNRKTVRFGRGGYTAHRDRPGDPHPHSAGQLDDSDVIDVEGREIPDKD